MKLDSPPLSTPSPSVISRITPQPKFATPEPPLIAKKAAIRRHIARVGAVRPRVAAQWDGVSENIVFSRDGDQFAQSASSVVDIRRTKDWKSSLLFGGNDNFALSGDFRLLATPDSFGKINVWRLRDRKLLYSLDGAFDIYWPLSFSPDNRQLAAIGLPEWLTSREGPTNGYPQSNTKDLRIWTLGSENKRQIQTGPSTNLYEGVGIAWTKIKIGEKSEWKAFSFAGYGDSKVVKKHTLWVRTDHYFIEARDDTTGELISYVRNPGKMGPIALTPDATLFAGADAADPFVYIWRLTDGKLLYTIKRPDAQKALSLAFSSDSKQLAISFLDSSAPANTPTAARNGETIIYALNRKIARRS